MAPLVPRGVTVAEPDQFEEAVALHRAGRSTEAEALCEAILAQTPTHARALHLLGAIRFAGGRTAEAIALVERAIAAKPDYPEAEFNLGAMLTAVGRPADAAEHFGRTVALRPDHVEAQARLAATLMNLRRYEAAEGAFHRLLALRPDDPAALMDLAALMLAHGNATGAIELSRRAVTLAPNVALTHLRLGHALRQNEDTVDAIAHYRRALVLQPELVEATDSLIVALRENYQFEESERLARQATSQRPHDAGAVCSLGDVTLSTGRADAAADLFRHAVALAPQDTASHRRLMSALLYVPGLSAEERFAQFVQSGRAMTVQAGCTLPPPPNDRDHRRRLRVGWLSSDFHAHPVGRNLEWLFRSLDRTRFELVGYAHVRQPNRVTEWFRDQADLWRSTVGLDDAEVAKQIRADRIDVMMYLAGRFDDNRPQVAAWRPAPVQVSFHDPATSGLAEMDYLIADPVLVPRRATERFTERVVRLPLFSIQPPVPDAPAVAPPPCRATGRPTFGSFSNPAKLSSNALALWAEILRRQPAAQLLLRYRQAFADASIVSRLRREFGEELMARVQFDVQNRPLADHLDVYRRIDVALDPFPFNGSTTTFEALWMGVPVVTLLGDTMVGRWSAGMLHALELDELIAHTPDEYVEIALRLAGDPERLSALRAQLRARVAASALCDGGRFTRHFERLVRALWCRWCGGG